MAAEIKAQHPTAEVKLVASSRGRFEVICFGRPIFEKSKLGRHARAGEILRLLADCKAAV